MNPLRNEKTIKFPGWTQYGLAFSNFNRFIMDEFLKDACPRTTKDNRVETYTGGYCYTVPVVKNGKTFAVRCWLKEVKDVKYRYQELSKYSGEFKKLSYMLEFAYIDQGIIVNDTVLPILRMEWSNGVNLKEFVKENLGETLKIRHIAYLFYQMVRDIHWRQMSHGDLHHENIIIDESNGYPAIKLIDYDSMCLPGLYGQPEQIQGVHYYQHPDRISRKEPLTSPDIDYFSELVIFLSLLSLSEKPDLWTSLDLATQDGILFSKDDFINPGSSEICEQLRKNAFSDEVHYLFQVLMEYCKRKTIDGFVPIEKLIPHMHGNGLFANGDRKIRGNNYRSEDVKNAAKKMINSINPIELNKDKSKESLEESHFEQQDHELNRHNQNAASLPTNPFENNRQWSAISMIMLSLVIFIPFIGPGIGIWISYKGVSLKKGKQTVFLTLFTVLSFISTIVIWQYS
jgi:hypothetical protein